MLKWQIPQRYYFLPALVSFLKGKQNLLGSFHGKLVAYTSVQVRPVTQSWAQWSSMTDPLEGWGGRHGPPGFLKKKNSQHVYTYVCVCICKNFKIYPKCLFLPPSTKKVSKLTPKYVKCIQLTCRCMIDFAKCICFV